jgi:O-antigen/teichoic acid export membrane protein
MFKDMLTLASGAAFAMTIGLVSTPVLTRIYSPEDFGVLALFNTFLLMLSPFLMLRYSSAIPLPRSDRLALNLVVLCAILAIFFAMILSLIFMLLPIKFFNAFGITKILPYLPFLLIGALLISFYELATSWMIRKRQFKVLSFTTGTQSLYGSSVKILLGIISTKPDGLIIGQIVQNAWGGVSLGRIVYIEFKKNINHIRLSLISKLFLYYLNYFYLKLPAHFLYLFASQLPVIYANYVFGIEITGQLALVFAVVGLPITAISQAISKSYYGEITNIGKYEFDKLMNLTLEVLKKMSILGILVGIVIFVLSEKIFILIFGSRWELAGVLAKVLALSFSFQLVSAPLIVALNVMNKNLISFFLHLSRAIVISLVFFICNYNSFDVVKTMSVYANILSVHYVLVIYIIYYLLNYEIKCAVKK